MPDLPVPEVTPNGGGGGFPQSIAGIPTVAVVLGVGGIVGVILILRARAGGTTGTTVPTIVTPTIPGTGGGGGGTTPGTPATTQYTQASILQSWVDAQSQLANLTDDAQKKLNRLGGSWTDIASYLIMNPNVLGEPGNVIRQAFTQLPAGYYTWITHVSNLYTSAKNTLVSETTQGYFQYMTLPQVIEYLRANPAIVTAHPEYRELTALPVQPTAPGG